MLGVHKLPAPVGRGVLAAPPVQRLVLVHEGTFPAHPTRSRPRTGKGRDRSRVTGDRVHGRPGTRGLGPVETDPRP